MESKRMAKYNRSLEALNLLIKNGYNREAAILMWITTRELIFEKLFTHRVNYNSTREALKKFLAENKNNSQLISNVLTLERVAILAEWDETFDISNNEILSLVEIHSHVSIILI